MLSHVVELSSDGSFVQKYCTQSRENTEQEFAHTHPSKRVWTISYDGSRVCVRVCIYVCMTLNVVTRISMAQILMYVIPK